MSNLKSYCFALLCTIMVFSCTEDHPAEVGRISALPEVVDFNFHIKPILSDRCFKCHGPDEATREAGLGLHTEAHAFAALGKAQDHYALVPGDPEKSTLIQRIFSEDPQEVMPPPESNLTLTAQEKALLRRWVEQGAAWKKHWAFLPPEKPQVPEAGEGWAQNEIDHFILARQQSQGLAPSPKADRAKLIRRLSFDLRGLPPTLEEVEAFVNDDRPDAWPRLVDTFLHSAAYAERMALDWMDIARYADTHGYQDDFERVMWPWRDWVIHAFQENMPYDQFVTWQLAGDLLPEPTLEQRIATGFNRNHKITAEGGVIDEEYRVEYVADRAQTLSTAFLGLTMECARCHDHKYDPISQKDYFSLFGFFNNIPEKGFVGELNQNFRYAPKPSVRITQEAIDSMLTFINNRDTLPYIDLMVMEEQAEPRKTYILNRGQYDQHAAEVQPAVPSALPSLPEGVSNNRLGLAKWLFAPENPLTARVTVNRLWQQLFGTGIVATPFDFGNQGALPTHPELLDFLAIKFREAGWDVKAMLRYMVQSATYQQTATASPELLERDPENRWLARAPRLRLQAEMIRDQAFAVSGLLNTTVGGPSVKPYQPEGLWEETTGGGGGSTARYVVSEGSDRYRKSLYTFWKRTVPPPGMLIMDAPSRDLCTVKRQETNTPLQALLLLNDPQVLEASKALALQAWEKGGNSAKERIAFIFQSVTSAALNAAELEVLLDYFEEERAAYAETPEAAENYLSTGAYTLPDTLPVADIAAYTLVANTIFNLDEAITRG
ncbi:MAG: PSD1 and planctomycete cytochrome C domain-containing protein [Phaeodactylibacter sp.]|uniref:PSD1 and planctomycete cytochrome C domain-containing protein n=1 Tax=Phaeodactylibacter sp. TaxID=1940289 RepID=UPI0032EC5C3C